MEGVSTAKRALAVLLAAVLALGTMLLATGCSSDSGEGSSNSEPITVVFLPDNSSANMEASRDAIAEIIKNATGRDVEIMTTTDYNVAIEALVSGQAQMGYLGAEGYVQANEKNDKVQCAFTASDANGGLDEACYYSRINVKTENADQYKDGDSYSINNIEGKSFSFVSAASTFGFAIPSSLIVETFGLESSDELLEDGKFFSSVMFGDSHPGSAVNLLSGNAEAAAFDDIDVDMYFDLVSGEPNTVGAVYQVKDDAEAPFDTVRGEQFTIIGITPVLNPPFCYNTETLTEDEMNAVTEAMCSEDAANSAIFYDGEDENAVGLVEKESDKTCFTPVEDAWYDPIRNLG